MSIADKNIQADKYTHPPVGLDGKSWKAYAG
jgi:hypothetical protein